MTNKVNAVATPETEVVVVDQEKEAMVAERNVLDQEQIVNNQVKTSDEIIRELITDGWKRLRNLPIRNVRITEMDNYTRLCFITNNPIIPHYRANEETGEWELVNDNKIFTSLYSVIGVMRDDTELSVVCNAILENPTTITALVGGGQLDIIYKEFNEGDIFNNPFTNSGEVVFDHDIVVVIVTGITPGAIGRRIVDAGLNALGAKLFGL